MNLMKIFSENKKALFDYEVLEKFEAGLVLFGQEVKSIKTGHINLSGSYVTLMSGEPYLVLHGAAERIAGKLGLTNWAVSLSHSRENAIAVVVATGA